MNIPRKHNPYLDPTNKQHRDYTRLDVSHSPDNVPDTPFNSPTAMSLSNTEWLSPNLNTFSLNQIMMDENKSSSTSSSSSHQSHQSHKVQPTSAHSDWRPISRDRAGSSGSERSEITRDSKECRCRNGGIQKRDSGDGPNSGFGSYSDSHCEQCILRDEGVERGRCRTRTNSSSSRDKTSGSREKKRRLDL
ncbi:hypothetical protein SS1G_05999 [Sclerotinia sclerotiorum 1980 UF-70]|uniref:Uncharacterized protein n=2 Tax=Sclerotinia sclerotiorum (strain ATCC 18683 / 1980 / Ss-1) TaxID=665079 RepID=A7EL02_SCLS1|nr:hypothetical protein SS1G_05999 [Sclerotinia sclerotiorum 1980 UF-70]APA09794.1 hypothetical protein sscle_05g045640 [Sclerotinia sclerotiorum 1980 UF-70]EDO03518.1 hypothetical protein SS1G_05999 [Sclerotinia sclerotiorum 1980 UF-70]